MGWLLCGDCARKGRVQAGGKSDWRAKYPEGLRTLQECPTRHPALIVPGKSASPNAEFEPALGDMVDRRDVLGQAQGVAQGKDLDGDPDLDAPRTGRQRGGDHERGRKYRSIFLEMDFGEPDRVETHLLGGLHLAQRLVERGRFPDPGRARKLREQTEFHPTLPIEFGLSYARASHDGGPRWRGATMPGDRVFDRTAEDIGNIILLEHVNVKIPDQVTATNFYVTALGLTRDPYIMTGTEHMWINAGQQQFHMQTGKPEVLRGVVGFVVPDLEGLKMRLTSAREKLGGTKFMCAADDKYVSVTCPW